MPGCQQYNNMEDEKHMLTKRDKRVLKCPDFVDIMQIYMVSHAIHQTKDIKFKFELRQHYRNEILSTVSSNCPCNLNKILENPLSAWCVDLGLHDLWELCGTLAGRSGAEVSKMLHDDRVLIACFMSQVLWAYASNDLKDHIAASVLSGTLQPELEIFAPNRNIPNLAAKVHQVLNVLGTCPEYIFDACPGFDKMLHIMQITDEVKFSELSAKGFSPFTRVDMCHSQKQYLATPLHVGNI